MAMNLRLLGKMVNCERQRFGGCRLCPPTRTGECRVDQGDHAPRSPTDPDVRDVAHPAPQITGSLQDDKSNEPRKPVVEDTAR